MAPMAISPMAGLAAPRVAAMAVLAEDLMEAGKQLYQEYNAAIGSVNNARQQYERACANHGADSWAAEQAQSYLDREIAHRDEVRARYDAASGERAGR